MLRVTSIRLYLRQREEMEEELWRLVFVNNGVKLTIDGSPVLEDLLAYEQDGLSILAHVL